MTDYTIFYKRQLGISEAWGPRESWDLFVSAYVPSERTTRVFTKASAKHKRWLVFPEYGYASTEYPSGHVFDEPAVDEAGFISSFWDSLPPMSPTPRICIDITGFIRPYLIYFVRWLLEKGVTRFDAVYSEPIQYSKRELTTFSGDVVKEVRQVAGFEGTHTSDISKDVLIIGAGYEDNLI